MIAGTCPPLPVLEAFAAGTNTDDVVEPHLGACAACRAAVEEARRNNLFLSGLRPLLGAHSGAGPAPGNSPDALNPELVSGYQIQEEIHRGGQGVVYRAVQTRTRRTVAIKMLLGGHAATGRRKERFEREVRIAAGLRHPNIVTVHDSGYIGDNRYGLVMEYIEGAPLDRWSRSLDEARGRDARRKALRQRLGVMAKVCDAVLCAHQHSIVHRDLKPGNILVDAAGEPHVLDFGIARDTGPEQHTRLTYTGEFAGTLAYASPEQLSGDLSKVDTRTDIYSLGVIMYEMVSGKMPYAVDGPMSRVIRSIETAEPVPLLRITRDPDGPWVDGEVSTIILKAMSKDPARRYQTAAGLRDDIARYLAGHAIEARRDSTWYILRKTAARHRIVVAGVAIIIVLLAVFGAAMAWQAHKLEVRGRELAGALSDSNVERGRMLAAAGNVPLAEEAVWPELIGAGVRRIEGPEAGFTGSPVALRAYWALWDCARRSSCVASLRTRGEKIELLYFDEGGRRLCALDNKGNLTAWSAVTWEPERGTSLIAPIDGVTYQAALAPGGAIGVFGGGELRVINPGTGAIDARAEDPDDQAVTGAFSPDGTRLATIGRDDRLRIRDARSLATLFTIAEPTVCRNHPWFCRPVFSPDGRLVAADRPDGSVGLWSTASGALERTLPPPDSLVSAVRYGSVVCAIAFGPDGTIAASMSSHLVVWPADGTAARDLGAPYGLIRSVAFLPGTGGRMLITCGNTPGGGGGVAIVWDLATGEQAATFRNPDETLPCAASPDARLIAVGCESGTVRVYETAPEPHVTVLQSGAESGEIVALSPDGRTVALPTATGDQWDLLLVDVQSGATVSRVQRRGPEIWSLEFAPDGSSLFEGDQRGRITQRAVPSGTVLREFAFPDPAEHRRVPHGTPAYSMRGFNQMRLSRDGGVLARARDDGLVGLWDVPSGGWTGWLDGGATETATIDFSPDGATLLAHHPGKCILWDVRTRQPARTLDTARNYPTARFSPDGAVIAHGVSTGIQFLDAGTGRALGENQDPQSTGLGMVFHPGGTVLFASALDSSIRLWDVRTGRELLSLPKHTTLIRSLLLTPDGNTLISSDASGLVLVWDLTYYNDRLRRELDCRIRRPQAGAGAAPDL